MKRFGEVVEYIGRFLGRSREIDAALRYCRGHVGSEAT